MHRYMFRQARPGRRPPAWRLEDDSSIVLCSEGCAPPLVASSAIRNDGVNTFEDVDSNLFGGDTAADVFVIRPSSPLPMLTDMTGGTWINALSQTGNGGDTNPFGPEIV